MKKIKILTAVLLSLCLAFAVTGCSGDNLKDSVINGFNDMLQHFSKYALTDEKICRAIRPKGKIPIPAPIQQIMRISMIKNISLEVLR